MKERGILRHLHHRVQVRPAAEPPHPRRPEHPRVHVHRRHPGRAHVRHQRNARCPEPRIAVQPRDLLARRQAAPRQIAQLPVNGRDIDPHLLEAAPFAHHRHHAAACILVRLARASRLLAFESPRRQVGEWTRRLRILQRLEGRTDAVAQLGEPAGRPRFPLLEIDPFSHTCLPRSVPRHLTTRRFGCQRDKRADKPPPLVYALRTRDGGYRMMRTPRIRTSG